MTKDSSLKAKAKELELIKAINDLALKAKASNKYHNLSLRTTKDRGHTDR